jgi:hypothetical protein
MRDDPILRTVAKLEHGHSAAGLVNGIDNSLAVPCAAIDRVAKLSVFDGWCTSRRIVFEA